MVLNEHTVQNFLYSFILEKIKTEKLSMQVDHRFEKYLNNLANPLQLNEMRTMKEEKYTDLRTLLSNFLGSPILRLIKDNIEEFEFDPDVFDLVYEGFWDLYTFHPAVRDVSARKLQGWIQKIKLISGPERAVDSVQEEVNSADGKEENPEEGEEGEEKPVAPTGIKIEGEDTYDQIAAVIRVKIPKVPKEIENDEEGNPIEDNTPESDLEDIPHEDKCLQVVTQSDE